MPKIVFTGGGSAGHVVPNTAIAAELSQNKQNKLFYIGTNGIEKRIISNTGMPFFEISCPKFTRSFSFKNAAIPFSLMRAVRSARRVLKKIGPDLVFSKGGFVSLPVVLAAAKEKIPVLTHESDLTPGLTTRLIAKKCRYVLTSFPETATLFANGKFTGSPLRKELFIEKDVGYVRGDGKKTLLVFGGGSGSRALNDAVFQNLEPLLKFCRILHVVGEKNLSAAPVKEGYTPIGYEKNMAILYKKADAVVARAGSNTLCELLALRIPSLIVPLEKGSRGDQKQNAEYFSKRGLIRVLSENELSKKLIQSVNELFNDAALTAALSNNPFRVSGNARILQTIRETLGDTK